MTPHSSLHYTLVSKTPGFVVFYLKLSTSRQTRNSENNVTIKYKQTNVLSLVPSA